MFLNRGRARSPEAKRGPRKARPSQLSPFSQTILGLSDPAAAEVAAARARCAELEWLAKISNRHEAKLNEILREEAAAVRDREHQQWAARIFEPNWGDDRRNPIERQHASIC